MKKICTLFILLFFSLMINELFAQTNVQDSSALVDIYNSTKGTDWTDHTNWLNGPVATWYGVTITGNRVTEIRLNSNKLKGTIPASIGNLVKLTSLSLDDNRLSGTIPSSIGNLVNLTYMNCGANQLTGNIPSSIGNLINLEQLLLYGNELSGPIPSSIGNLTKLTLLWLFSNELNGAIPSSIGNLVNLGALPLESNQLSGSIPPGLGNLVNLSYLYLSNNQLTGEIPSSFGNFVHMQYLELDHNLLTGKIPKELGNLSSLLHIHLEYNKLKGKVPSSFHHLKKLNFLFLDHNRLSGIDSSIIKLQKLQGLYLEHNRFTFDGPEWVAPAFPVVTYDKQARIDIHQNGNALSVSAGGTLTNNTYKWFSIGQQGNTMITGDSVFHPTQSGQYYVHVTNAIATELTLTSDTFNYTTNTLNKAGIISSATRTLYQKALFSVRPNPVRDVLYIRNNSKATFSLISQSGKVMVTKTINMNGEINVSNLSPGFYYLKNNATGDEQKVVIVK